MIARQEEYVTDWQNCYNLGWTDLLIPPAIAHPAKMSRALCFKIVAHLLDEGLIQPGQTVIDPFAGVGTTALPCLMAGLNYVGVELEPRFADWAQQNIDLWNAKFLAMPKWTGTARIINGDSRNLAQLVRGAGVVSSPPFSESVAPGLPLERQRETSSPKDHGGPGPTYQVWQNTPGQLGAIKAGDFGAALVSPGRLSAMPGNILDMDCSFWTDNEPPGGLVSSPPFAGNSGGRGEASRNGIDAALFDRHSGGMTGGMGDEPGNLGNLPVRGFEAVVSSPPFENGVAFQDKSFEHVDRRPGRQGTKWERVVMGETNSGQDYGQTPGQLGNDQGETFWAAARAILLQCAMVLPSGAPAVWVTKDFIKNGRRVEFSRQWAELCEACGFKVIHVHRAWLVKRNGKQGTIDGGAVENVTERKSFFRRLSEANNKAAEHWKTLDRKDQARVLWASHTVLWANYRRRLEAASDDDEQPPKPNRSRILREARKAAWVRDDEPDYQLDTVIDWESVICTIRL